MAILPVHPSRMHGHVVQGSVDGFIENKPRKERRTPDELTECLDIYSQGAYGLGFMCSVLLVFVVGKISEKGDKPSWFQSTSNRSHLDHYYWVLAVLSGTSLVIFSVWCMLVNDHQEFQDKPQEFQDKHRDYTDEFQDEFQEG